MTGKKSKTNPTRSSSSDKNLDRLLPIANLGRIMKKTLPTNAKISKEAKETVQECVSEFISFITGEAADKCQREKRKTINGDDLLWAMTTLGFDNYVDPLNIYLHKYKEIEENNTMISIPSKYVANDISKVNNSISSNKLCFQIFNKGYEEHGEQICYEENLMDSHEIGNRTMAAHFIMGSTGRL